MATRERRVPLARLVQLGQLVRPVPRARKVMRVWLVPLGRKELRGMRVRLVPPGLLGLRDQWELPAPRGRPGQPVQSAPPVRKDQRATLVRVAQWDPLVQPVLLVTLARVVRWDRRVQPGQPEHPVPRALMAARVQVVLRDLREHPVPLGQMVSLEQMVRPDQLVRADRRVPTGSTARLDHPARRAPKDRPW